jgi:hypothetical protein
MQLIPDNFDGNTNSDKICQTHKTAAVSLGQAEESKEKDVDGQLTCTKRGL